MGSRMGTAVLIVLLGCVALADGEHPLTLQVSPKVAPAPGWVRVSARIEPNDDNRQLEVTAASDEFERITAIQLNGRSAPRLSVVDYSNLPAGNYEITAVLVGSNGRRAAASRVVQIVPMPGQR